MMKMDRRSLPDGWRWAKLGEICTAIRGVTFQGGSAKASAFENSVACLTTSGVQSEVDWASRRFIPRDSLSSEEQLLQTGDLLVSTANSKALVGKSSLVVDVPFECTFGAFVTVLRAKTQHAHDPIPHILAYWMRTSEAMAFCYETSSNTTNISNLRVSDLLDMEIPLPPLDEQRRIAAILSEQLAVVERARAAAEGQLEAAEALPAAYLREVFGDSQQWPAKRLGDLLQLRKEVVHPYDKPSGPAAFVGLEHIESGTGIRTGLEPVEMSKLTGRKPRFYKGDIVYGYLRPYLNKVWVAEFDGLCSVDQYVYSVDASQADTAYVAWFMRSPSYLKRAPIDTSPGQLPRIRTEEVAAVEISLPPLDEQRRTVGDLESRLASTKQAHDALQSQLDAINRFPAALLRRAFNGEL